MIEHKAGWRGCSLFAIITLLALLIRAGSVFPESSTHLKRTNQSMQTLEGDHSTTLDANNLLLTVSNHGVFAPDYEEAGYVPGLVYPPDHLHESGFEPHVLWIAGPWLIGKVNGDLRVAASRYVHEYTPGPMQNGSHLPPDSSYQVFKLYADSLESNPNQDYLEWPIQIGAPVNDEGKPKLYGEQTLWTVFNDADPNRHTNEAGSTLPLGVEMQLTAWASDDDGDIQIPLQWSLDLTRITSGEPRLIESFVEITDHSLLTGHDYQLVVREDPLLGDIAELSDLTSSTVLVSEFPLEERYRSSRDVNIMETSLGFRLVIYLMSNAFESFQVLANGTGQLDHPVAGALPEQGFPTGHDSLGNPIGLTAQQQVGEGLWAIHAKGYSDKHASYEGFLSLLYYDGPKRLYNLDSFDYEIRFTGSYDDTSSGGSYATAYFEDKPMFWVPFEIWNTGIGTPDDSTDDFRLVPLVREKVTNRIFDLESWGTETAGAGYFEHVASPGDNDPFTDRFTGYIPEDTSPGESGYLAAVDKMNADTFWKSYYWLNEQPGWWVLINVDGGSSPPFNQSLPEPGTVFRITKTSHIPVDTFHFTAAASDFRTSGPDGMSIYLQYKLYNKSDHVIDSFYFSLFAEPSNEIAQIACDTLDDLFIGYAGYDHGDVFGFWPPAVGCKIVRGLVVPTPGDTAHFCGNPMPDYRNLGMTSLSAYHINGMYPNSASQTDWYIRARTPWEGNPYIYNGDSLSYFYSGDPVSGTGDLLYPSWVGQVWQSCGPVQFLPGDSQCVLLKLAVGQGQGRLESITSLREILNLPDSVTTDVNDDPRPVLPKQYSLDQNYPNPFNPATTIDYSVPERSHVTIEVFNILGQKVRTLVDREQSVGSYSVPWNGIDASGKSVATGVYFYRLAVGEFIETKKMMLLK